MKKFAVVMFGALVVLSFSVGPVMAIPPFAKEFNNLYVEGNSNEAFVAAVKEAKCNVCHVGKDKKDRNAYGEELNKLLDKKADAKNVDKIKESLEKVAALKAGDSEETYGELITAGKLPGGEAK